MAVPSAWKTANGIQEVFESWDLLVDVDIQGERLILKELSKTDDNIRENIATVLYVIDEELSHYKIPLEELGIFAIIYNTQNESRIITQDIIQEYLSIKKDKDKLKFTKELFMGFN
jgi:hypothetical protein